MNVFFTEADLKRIRAFAADEPKFLDGIERRTENVRRKLYIQDDVLATWTHYYNCPKHSVRLNFDYDSPNEYVCPVDGEVFTGEPQRGAWWSFVLSYNSEACVDLAVGYLLTEDESYLAPIREMLTEYAKRYAGYEIHGNVPYNEPGKMTAQVLHDALYLFRFARAYMMIRDAFCESDKKLIEEGLFREGAKYMMKTFTPQIHNHEVMICSSLGYIGLILDDEEILEFAVNGKYGLKYQLDFGLLDDGLWFEGSLGYHMGTFAIFIEYEKFARYNEKYSLLACKRYRDKIYKMLTFVDKIGNSDKNIPKTNDGAVSYKAYDRVFEFAYSYFGTPEILHSLYRSLEGTDRSSIDTLLYGVRELPPDTYVKCENYYARSGSNIAMIHGECDTHLFFKAIPFGGEHDHYDRLALSFSAFGKPVSADLSTAGGGYGAPLHYGYFKNTATHNTVVINGDNMPPAPTHVIEYTERTPDDITLDAVTDWSAKYEKLDSFTIKQWVDESYEGVKMRRHVRWLGDYFVDIFALDSENELRKEWVWHTDGILKNMPFGATSLGSPWDKNPQAYLHDAYAVKNDGVVKLSYDCGGFDLDIHTLAGGMELVFAQGPNNPATSDISYLLERTSAKNVIYVNVIEAHKSAPTVKNVNISVQNRKVSVKIEESSGKVRSVDLTV